MKKPYASNVDEIYTYINFMTGETKTVPSSLLNLFQSLREECLSIYNSITGSSELNKEIAEIINSKVPNGLTEYFKYIESLKIEEKSDEDLIKEELYFHLYALACEFNRFFTSLVKISGCDVSDDYLMLAKKNKKLLKRLAKLDFGQHFSEAKVNEYRDNIYYVLLSDQVCVQDIYVYRKDFISALKISEQLQEYRDCIKDNDKSLNIVYQSIRSFFLSALYNDIQNYEQSFSLFKEACDNYFGLIKIKNEELTKVPPISEHITRNCLRVLLASGREAVQNKKNNLIEVFVKEIPRLQHYIQTKQVLSDNVKQEANDAIELFYQEYSAFLKQTFDSDPICFDEKKRFLIVKNKGLDPRRFSQDPKVKWVNQKESKQKQYVMTNCHLQTISQIESFCVTFKKEYEKLKLTKAEQAQAKKQAKSAVTSNLTQISQPEIKQQQTELQLLEQKPKTKKGKLEKETKETHPQKTEEKTKKVTLPPDLKASDLGFDKKYDNYKIYEIEKRGITGVFYGFFKPAKKLLHFERITEDVLTNHKNILSKEKTVGPQYEKGIKFVPLPNKVVKQYQQELKQKQNNNNNAESTKVNLTLKLGYTLKTKPLTKDIEFLAKVAEIKEDPKTGKQKILFRFWQAIDHKDDVMAVISKTLKW